MSDESQPTFQCEYCQSVYAWKPELAGQRVACRCGARIVVPEVVEVPQPAETSPLAPVMAIPLASSSVSPATQQPPTQPPPFYAPPSYSMVDGSAGFYPPSSYPAYVSSARPGGLIALAIVSIIIGCLSILASGFMSTLWRSWAVASMPPAATQPPPLPAVTFQPYSGAVIPPGGFAAPMRAKIISDLTRKTPLSPEQIKSLDTLLAEAGADILPTRSAGDLQLQDTRQHGYTDLIHFQAPQGVVAVGTGMCSYHTPDDVGSVNVTGNFVRRYSAREGVYFESWNAPTIQSAMEKIRASAPAVSNMQLGFVLNELQDPSRKTTMGMLPSEVTPLSASLGGGNILSVTMVSGSYQILPDGRGIKIDADNPGLDPATGRPLPSTNASFHPLMPGDPHVMYELYVYCMAVVALAMFLIIGAIVTLIKPWLWAWMHLPFAALKIVGICTEIYLSLAFFASLSSNTGATRQYNSDAGMNGLVETCIVQAIYPIVLILMYLLNPRLRRMPRA